MCFFTSGLQQSRQNGKPAFTVTWRARDGEAEACANIIARFLPEARKEPGVELVTVNRSVTDPAKFLFSEVFSDEAALEAHQQVGSARAASLTDYCGNQHATWCIGAASPSGGSSRAHRSTANRQRLRKRQPVGSSAGLGGSP